MSLASDWAMRNTQDTAAEAMTAAAKPPSLQLGYVNIVVSEDGGLYIDKEARLSHDEALLLAAWLISTFGG